MSKTTIQLDDDVREKLRDYQLPSESANDAVARLMEGSEPPSQGVSEREVEEIARDVVNDMVSYKALQ